MGAIEKDLDKTNRADFENRIDAVRSIFRDADKQLAKPNTADYESISQRVATNVVELIKILQAFAQATDKKGVAQEQFAKLVNVGFVSSTLGINLDNPSYYISG